MRNPPVLPAFLSSFFFALNATCANHSIRLLGTLRANLSRLVIGTLCLGLFAHTLGGGFRSAGTAWFFLSGAIGLGLGDLGTYGALPLLGSRLTVLMVQCLAAPLAALGEWWWLGTRLSGTQMACGAVILSGVAVAVVPSRSNPPHVRVRPMGFVFGFIGACGQGLGAALVSRKAATVAAAAGESVSNVTFGLTAAYERLLAGLAFTLCWFLVLRLIGRLPRANGAARTPGRAPWLWTLANGLAGPVAGVGAYQWALATTPSGIVLPIVATTPLVSIPIAFWLEGDRPTRRSVVGGVIAVAGCIVLTLVSRR
jgi:drug/metabolite transporter (DMT)-like permease